MTAEEFMNQEEYEPDSGISFSDYHGDIAGSTESLMVDFAKYHVREALKEAQYMADCKEISCEESNEYYRNRIKESYPETNIK